MPSTSNGYFATNSFILKILKFSCQYTMIAIKILPGFHSSHLFYFLGWIVGLILWFLLFAVFLRIWPSLYLQICLLFPHITLRKHLNKSRRHAYKAWKFRKLSSHGIFLSISGYIINHAYSNNDIPSFILRSRSYFFEHNLCYYLKSELIIVSQIDFFLIILRNTCLLCKAGRSPIECS